MELNRIRPWQRERKRRRNRPTGYNAVNRKLYNSSRWRKYSKNFRLGHRRCNICNKLLSVITGLCVDHIIPIQQGGSKWDTRNHQAICKSPCHARKTGKESTGTVYEYKLNRNEEKIPIDAEDWD